MKNKWNKAKILKPLDVTRNIEDQIDMRNANHFGVALYNGISIHINIPCNRDLQFPMERVHGANHGR
jgi:hypothetical protein